MGKAGEATIRVPVEDDRKPRGRRGHNRELFMEFNRPQLAMTRTKKAGIQPDDVSWQSPAGARSGRQPANVKLQVRRVPL